MRRKKVERTIVVFRRWRNGDIIALFPYDPSDHLGYYCQSYEHVGQHGGADYQLVLNATKPARPQEYRELAGELRRRGYRLEVRKRVGNAIVKRRAVLAAWAKS